HVIEGPAGNERIVFGAVEHIRVVAVEHALQLSWAILGQREPDHPACSGEIAARQWLYRRFEELQGRFGQVWRHHGAQGVAQLPVDPRGEYKTVALGWEELMGIG